MAWKFKSTLLLFSYQHFIVILIWTIPNLPINLCHVWDAKYKIIQLINTGKMLSKKRKTYGFYGRNMRYKQTCCWLKILSGSVALLFPFFPPRKDLIIFPPPLICRIFMTYFGVFNNIHPKYTITLELANSVNKNVRKVTLWVNW